MHADPDAPQVPDDHTQSTRQRLIDLRASLRNRDRLLDALKAEYRGVRAALLEAIAWLESRPDCTEGDIATASRCRAALAAPSDVDEQEVVIQNVGIKITDEMRRQIEQALDSGRSVRFAEPVGIEALCWNEDADQF